MLKQSHMQLASLTKNLEYGEKRPAIQVLMETESTKEIRIAMRKGQLMKEHKTPFPIVVEIFEGSIDFGVQGEIYNLGRGDMISLEGDVPHDLRSHEDSIVRLTISKLDKVERVRQVIG